MSFAGIRRIRQSRRQSPIIFQSTQLVNPKPIQLIFDVKSSLLSNQIRTTRDSELKSQLSTKHTRKNSFVVGTPSREKDKKTLVGNFLHINLENLRGLNPTRELRNFIPQTSKTDRLSLNKSFQEDNQRATVKISLSSFTMDFVIGKGGFSKVWKVHEKSTNKVYAMKQMLKVKIIAKRSINSAMNQKILLSKIKNPFLVNMIYAFQTRQNLFLVMDYCNRGDLRYHLGNKRKFKQQQTRFFVACIVLCLQYLHSKRIIHRDLKPQNLVLDDRGYLRLTDLGVSRQVKANNAEDTSGTPGYMSPEVICKMNHSYPVDFFALGVIAYEFMTGKRPYVGADRKQIRERILAKQVQLDQIPPFGWSKQSVDFINRLIRRKPQNRLGYTGIQQLKLHPFLAKIDWQKLQEFKLTPPFIPQTIEQDYGNYKLCISEDTEISNMDEYNIILRHKDAEQAFSGYQYNNFGMSKMRILRKQANASQTTMKIRKHK